MVPAGPPNGPMDAVLQGAATHVAFGYVAVQHPIPGVGVLFMLWTHCSLVMFVPVAAMDIDADDARTRPSARTKTISRPFIFELTIA